LRASDLRPLNALEHVCILEAPSAVAPAIAHSLPALISLMLSGDPLDDDDPDDDSEAPPPPEPPVGFRVLGCRVFIGFRV